MKSEVDLLSIFTFEGRTEIPEQRRTERHVSSRRESARDLHEGERRRVAAGGGSGRPVPVHQVR